MKRIIALLLSILLLLSGCTQAKPQSQSDSVNVEQSVTEIEPTTELIIWEDVEPQYSSLDETQLLAHVEDLVYQEAVSSINSEEYFVENVTAVYISKEYLDEVTFDSQTNIYFGYTLAELDDLFQGTRYVFTLSDSGTTTVQELQEIEDVSTETMLKNVAIGTGVILVCVTVSVVSGGVAAPTATSIFFAVSAKNAAIMAGSSASLGGITAGIIRGIQTGNFGEAMEAGAMAATEGFKWGAISGIFVSGAEYAKAMYAFRGVSLKGLTLQQAAAIQLESKYPLDVIKQFSNMKQYAICKKAGLTVQMVNGQTALIRNIDLDYVDDFGYTNQERMKAGLAAIDSETGTPFQLHHIGQKEDSTLAILTEAEHMQEGNNLIWHNTSQATEVHGLGNNWNYQRQAFWKTLSEIIGGS